MYNNITTNKQGWYVNVQNIASYTWAKYILQKHTRIEGHKYGTITLGIDNSMRLIELIRVLKWLL